MQLKESSLEQFYTDYLEQYAAARRSGATPTNMHPEDTPTIVFIVDTLIQLCSLPVSFAVRSNRLKSDEKLRISQIKLHQLSVPQ